MSGNQKQAPSGAPQPQRYAQGPYPSRVSTPQRAEGYHAAGYVPSQPSNLPSNQGSTMRGMAQAGPPNQPSTPPQNEIKQMQQPQQGQLPMTYVRAPHQYMNRPQQPQHQGGPRMQSQHRQTMPSTVPANSSYFPSPTLLLSQMAPPPAGLSYQMHAAMFNNAPRHTQFYQPPVTHVLPSNQYMTFNYTTQPAGQTQQFFYPHSAPMQMPNRPSTQVQTTPQAGAQTAQQPLSLQPVVIPQPKNKSRPNAVAIVDPVSGKEVNVDEQEVPTPSSESSARETPQPAVISSIPLSSVLVEYDCGKPNDGKEHVEAEHIPLFETPVLPQHHNPSTVRIHPSHGGVTKENNVYHKVADSSLVQHSKLQASTKEFIPDIVKHTTPVVSANSDGVEVTLPNKSRDRESPSKTRRPHRESIPKEPSISESSQSLPIKEVVVPNLPVAPMAPQILEVVEIQVMKPIPTSNAKTRSTESKGPLLDQRTSIVSPPITNIVEDSCVVTTGKKKESQKAKETTGPNQVQQPSKPAMPVPGSQPTKPSSKSNKMRELNIKGASKEGTDMDAFSSIEAPAIDNYNNQTTVKEESSEKSVPPQPAPPQINPVQVDPELVQQQLPVQNAPQQPPPPAQKLSDVKTLPKMTVDVTSIVKDDAPRFSKPQVQQPPPPPQPQPTTDSQDETDRAACEKLVQVKNETNRSKSENTDTQAIDKTVVRYKKDQWSPVNPEGQKRYEPDFLRFLSKNNPKCQKKPESLPDLDIIINDSNRQRVDLRAFPNRQPEMLMPSFHKSSSQRGSVTKRGSQQGKANMKGGKPTTIHVSLSLREDIKLRETENAWKPARMVVDAKLTEDELKTAELYKKVRGVLNKLTPEKFEKLVGQVRELPIDNTERLQGVIDLVFEKAVDEPNFSVAYALMCKELGTIQVPASTNKDQPEVVNFRKLIITRCQMEFEKNSQDEKAQNQKMKELEECTDPEKKKELLASLEEQERRIRMKSVGNIRFIGELFKQSMLTPKIMVRCILDLLKSRDEDRLECLCKLLTTIGKELESSQNLTQFFNQMHDIVEKKHGKVSSRVRFMLQDVIDLRNSNWIPRRQDLNPKKMEQIQKEADTEQLNIQVMNSGSMNTPRKDDRMGGGNMGGDRKRRNNQPDDGGWSTAGSRGRAAAYTVESHKLMNKPPPICDMTLGSKNLFDRWGLGSNIKTQMQAPVTNTANMYAALEKLNLEQENTRSSYDSRMNKTPYSSKGHSTERSSYNKHNYNDGRNSRSGSQHRNPPTSQHQQPQQQKLVQPSSTQAPAPVSPAQSLLSPEQLKLRMKNIMDEYLNDCCSLEDSISDIHASLQPSNMPEFIVQIYNEVLERSDPMRLKAGKLFALMVTNNVVSIDVFVEALKEVLSQADDLVIDIPKLWDYLALMILPLITDNVLTLKTLVACKSVFNDDSFMPELLAELFKHLVKDNGANYVFDLWRTSGVQFTDFLSTDVDNYLKQHKLDFLMGGAAVPVGQQPLSWEQVYAKLLQFLKSETVFNTITDWIETNLGERVKENQFIRTLVTAIIENDIVSINNTKKLKEELLKSHFVLLQRYIDNNEAFELHCLFALQALAHKWEHPQGLLLSICEKLWDANIISSDALESWEKDTNPAENAGKTVAFMSLQRLFTATKEGDDEESASESAVDEADGDED